MGDEALLQQAMDGDLQSIYKLAGSLLTDDAHLERAYLTAKHGVTYKFHIGWITNKMYTERDRDGTVLIKGTQYTLEDWWDEIEARENQLRAALISHLTEEDEAYEGR